MGGLSRRNGANLFFKSAQFCVDHLSNRYDDVSVILSRAEDSRLKQEQDAWKSFLQSVIFF